MPLFEYHCKKCAKTFEKLLKKQQAAADCPQCGLPAQITVSVFASTGGCDAPSGSGFG